MPNYLLNLLERIWHHFTSVLAEELTTDDYAALMTQLLFLKMDEEHTKPPYNKPAVISQEYGWQSLISCNEKQLLQQYALITSILSKKEENFSKLFKRQIPIKSTEDLRYLIELIEKGTWLN